ncbi:MAG TPA: DUF4142 domain-containing protein [Bryobacteraceae bacterium]|nr:DUF4142 domain-containing protein [Bryobacteraceae bacterium]
MVLLSRSFVGGVFFAGLSLVVGQQKTAPPVPKSADARFLLDAVRANYLEVAYASWVKDHGSNPDLKGYAAKIVDDRTDFGDRLREFAARYKLSVGGTQDDKSEAEYRRLQTLDPGVLDQAYLQDVSKIAEKELTAYQHEASTGTDPEVKQWAYAMLRPLQEGLQKALDAQKLMDGASSE